MKSYKWQFSTTYPNFTQNKNCTTLINFNKSYDKNIPKARKNLDTTNNVTYGKNLQKNKKN